MLLASGGAPEIKQFSPDQVQDNYTYFDVHHYAPSCSNDGNEVAILSGLMMDYIFKINSSTCNSYDGRRFADFEATGSLFPMAVGSEMDIKDGIKVYASYDTDNQPQRTDIQVVDEANNITLNGVAIGGPSFDIVETTKFYSNGNDGAWITSKREILWSQLLGFPIFVKTYDSDGNFIQSLQLLEVSGVRPQMIAGSLASVVNQTLTPPASDSDYASLLASASQQPQIMQDTQDIQSGINQENSTNANANQQQNQAMTTVGLGLLGAVAGGTSPNVAMDNALLVGMKNSLTGQSSGGSAVDLAQEFSGPLGSGIGLNIPSGASDAADAGGAGLSSGASGEPYSEWTDVQKQALANHLTAQANQECAQYANSNEPEQRASYEDAACTEGVFYLGVPTDYPGRDAIKTSFEQNVALAKQLGSNAPVLEMIP